jgi:thymidylate kinase
MIIIFEGPDRVGKDTQIKMIQSYYIGCKFHILKYSDIKGLSGGLSEKYNTQYYNEMFELLSNNAEYDFICNRSHLGEYVYAPLYRGYSGNFVFDIEEDFKLCEFFNYINLITLIDTPENLVNREDGESLSDNILNKQKEIQRFKEATEKSKITKKIIININNKSKEQVHKEIIKFLEII